MRRLYPDARCERIGLIDLKELESRGIKGLLVDIDNTLVPYDEKRPTASALAFLADAKQVGMTVALVSNNSRSRVEKFAAGLDVIWLHKARKPMRYGFLRLAKQMGLSCSEIAVIGDQLFTDIYGANRCGMYSILVEPILDLENRFFRLKRHFEKKVMNHMKKRGIS